MEFPSDIASDSHSTVLMQRKRLYEAHEKWLLYNVIKHPMNQGTSTYKSWVGCSPSHLVMLTNILVNIYISDPCVKIGR